MPRGWSRCWLRCGRGRWRGIRRWLRWRAGFWRSRAGIWGWLWMSGRRRRFRIVSWRRMMSWLHFGAATSGNSRHDGDPVDDDRTRVGHPRLATPPIESHIGYGGWLSREWSWGWDCIEFLEKCLGWRLLEWQQWLYVHALEKGPDRQGFRFSRICVLVSRQNGKSQWLKGLGLWRLFMDPLGQSTGGCPGAKTVLMACQNLKYAEAMLKEVAEDLGGCREWRGEYTKHRLDT